MVRFKNTPESESSITAGSKVYQDKNRGSEKLNEFKKMMKYQWGKKKCGWLHKIKEGPPERVLSDGLAHVRHQGELQDERDATC